MPFSLLVVSSIVLIRTESEKGRMNGEITVIGLGPGGLEQLPLGIYKLLKQERLLFLRTKEHPVVAELIDEGLSFEYHSMIFMKSMMILLRYTRKLLSFY